MVHDWRLSILLVASTLALACVRSTNEPTNPFAESCEGYPPWSSSPYVLPYPVGTAYLLAQGNCHPPGHGGVFRYSYDWNMPIGTLVTAARSGTVVAAIGSFDDGDYAHDHANLVTVRHEDGTFALYGHLTRNGALVTVGRDVAVGDALGLSGDSGNTGGIPHLHFHVARCAVLVRGGCETEPVTFRNTDPNPNGLMMGRSYPARSFEPN